MLRKFVSTRPRNRHNKIKSSNTVCIKNEKKFEENLKKMYKKIDIVSTDFDFISCSSSGLTEEIARHDKLCFANRVDLGKVKSKKY
jgi:hypothetical protein